MLDSAEYLIQFEFSVTKDIGSLGFIPVYCILLGLGHCA